MGGARGAHRAMSQIASASSSCVRRAISATLVASTTAGSHRASGRVDGSSGSKSVPRARQLLDAGCGLHEKHRAARSEGEKSASIATRRVGGAGHSKVSAGMNSENTRAERTPILLMHY